MKKLTERSSVEQPNRREFLTRAGLGTIGAIVVQSQMACLEGPTVSDLQSIETSPSTALPPSPGAHEWDFYHKIIDSNKDLSLINAVDVTFGSDPLLKHSFIFADTVYVNGEHNLRGHNLYIHARRIICRGDCLIDLSAPENTKKPVSKSSSLDLGGKGDDGDTGDGGLSGGIATIYAESIVGTLTIKSNGGKGGVGQKGGSGGPGRTGLEGDPPFPYSNNLIKCSDYKNKLIIGGPGGGGGKGGQAGSGGRGGDGGNSGPVLVRCIDLSNGKLSFSVEGGEGGDPGKEGEKGEAGPKGLGGPSVHCSYKEYGNFEEGWDECDCSTHSSRGAEGPPGGEGDPPSLTPKSGKGRSIPPDVTAGNYESIGSLASYEQLQMLFRKACVDYILGRFQDAFDRFNWIHKLTQKGSGSVYKLIFSSLDPSILQTIPNRATSSADITLLRDKCESYLGQMAMGRDFYGYHWNFVPLVDFSSYKARFMETFFPIADSIENAYRESKKKAEAQQEILDELKTGLSKSEGIRKALQSQRDAADNLILEKDKEALRKWESITTYQNLILEADDSFKAAVKRKNEDKGGCDLRDTLKVIYNVASLVVPTVGAVASSVEGIAKVFASGKAAQEVLDRSESLVKVAKAVGVNNATQKVVARIVFTAQNAENAGRAIAESYKKIKTELGERIEADAGKIVVDEESYNQILKDYLDLPQARQYKQLLDTYVALTKSRNQNLLELQALLAERQRLDLELEDSERVHNKISGLIAESSDSNLLEYKNFLSNLYYKTRFDLLRILSEERRALEYWALEKVPMSLDRIEEVALLKSQHLDFDLVELEKKKSNRIKTKIDLNNWGVELTRASFPAQFKEMEKSKRISFDISADTILLDGETMRDKLYWGATAARIDVDFPGSDVANYSALLRHNGTSNFIRQDGQLVAFSHEPVSAYVEYSKDGSGSSTNPDQENITRKSDEFVYVSPLALWTLQMTKAFDVTKVDRIRIRFRLFVMATS